LGSLVAFRLTRHRLIRLSTFGSVDLRAPDDTVLDSVLAQPKRVALLVYLAAARPPGFHRRDRLVALFWPELDDARARDALSQALRFLRQALGSDVVITRGVDEVGIDRSRMWCDVEAFRTALDDTRALDALQLYRGDFLDGVFVEEASGFEEWVESERAALRELAARGARQLAEHNATQGAYTVAVGWGRRAAELAPDDERAFRRLLGLLDRAGDRVGALQAYEDFARRLRAEYGAEPAAETRAMADAIRRSRGMPDVAVATPPERLVLSPEVQRGPPERHAHSSAPFAAGSRLANGNYVIEGVLGIGGMATVYLAYDVRHERRVAVKVLKPEIAASVGAKGLLREIRIAASLQHPHIVPLFDSGESDGNVFYVMPQVAGESLRTRLQRERALPLDVALRIARDIADALAYAHRQGIVHRDIKPDNILLSGDSNPGEFHAMVADFGVAKAFDATRLKKDATIDGTLSLIGGVVGTPRYMAPEQASGGRVDCRADLFAWGVVTYEFLAGEHPFSSFTADPRPAAVAQRDAVALGALRGDVVPELSAIIMQCLAHDPASRPSDGSALLQALEELPRLGPSPATPPLRSPVTGRERLSRGRELLALVRRTWPALVAAAAILGVIALRGVITQTLSGDAVSPIQGDTAVLAVLPLERDADSLSEASADVGLHEAFSRYEGVVTVDRFHVADAVARRGGVHSGHDAANVASDLGAGRYVRGHLRRVDGMRRLYLALYEVGRDAALHQVSEVVGNDPEAASTTYARLAELLLLRGTRSEGSSVGRTGTHSLPALQATERAQSALANWDLPAADSAFEAAVAFDPQYAPANVWLAQVRVWRGVPTDSWAPLAKRAMENGSRLSEKEREMAQALVSLASGQYDGACRVYDALRRQHDRDFVAWFGLGLCKSSDRVVVPDPSSPSKWRFRSSYHAAVDAYAHAFELLPSVHRGYEGGGFDWLLATFLLVRTEVVTGYSEGRNPRTFFGRPAWIDKGDTLALIPYPDSAVYSGDPTATPQGFDAAHVHLRARYRKIAAGWSAAFPRSAGAKQALAISLELDGDPASVDTLRLARALATSSAQQLRLAAAEVLLRVKFGAPADLAQLRAASILADSLLTRRVQSGVEAEILSPIAALRGKCAKAEQLARLVGSAGYPPSIPGKLITDARALLARSALGCFVMPPTPTLRELDSAFVAREPEMPPKVRWLALQSLLYRPALLADTLDSAALDRLTANAKDSLTHAALEVTHRNYAAARKTLRSFRATWLPERGPATPDVVYPGARFLIDAGDRDEAVRWLDQSLGAVRMYDPKILADMARTATFVRSMTLRADLARSVGDARSMKLWGSAVATLWSDADSDLLEITTRVAAYAK
jgi:serine/threonine-protein kinase